LAVKALLDGGVLLDVEHVADKSGGRVIAVKRGIRDGRLIELARLELNRSSRDDCDWEALHYGDFGFQKFCA